MLTGEIKDEILKLRAIERILSSVAFGRLYTLSGDEERIIIEDIIKNKDKYALNKWMIKIAKQYDHTLLSLIELRKLANTLNIYRYQYLSKDELIEAIIRERNDQATNSNNP